MKGDRELCTAAVAQHWKALEWASEEMKGNRELCMAAVAEDWHAFEYVGHKMKNDEEVLRAGIQHFWDAGGKAHVAGECKRWGFSAEAVNKAFA